MTRLELERAAAFMNLVAWMREQFAEARGWHGYSWRFIHDR